MSRTRVGIIFGGRSGEHEVSVRSARGIAAALDPERFEAVLLGIDREGRWHRLAADALSLPEAAGGPREVVGRGALVPTGPFEVQHAGEPGASSIDVFFPIVHGSQGEDGCLQGLLEMSGVPYVGCGVLGCAVGMDKDVSKRLLRDAGLPVVPWLVARAGGEASPELARRVAKELGFPCFVKPANLGSSVGIGKAKTHEELLVAIDEAFRFDEKLVVEKGLDAREIETAVLGDRAAQVSVPGEVVPRHEFYSYEAKYVDEQGAELLVPAPLSPEQTEQCRTMALEVFRALELEGLARVDFFLERGTGRWYVNEVNTLPGFTPISMYSRMWEASGVPYRTLITRLVEHAQARHERRRKLSIERS